MIEIRITDPQHESPTTLKKFAQLLIELAEIRQSSTSKWRTTKISELPSEKVLEDDQKFPVGCFTVDEAAPNSDKTFINEMCEMPSQETMERLAKTFNAPIGHVISTNAVDGGIEINASKINLNKPVQGDVNGLPWDARIHSSSKNTNRDGTWRYMRGVDKDLIKKVEDELSGIMSLKPKFGILPLTPDMVKPITGESVAELMNRANENSVMELFHAPPPPPPITVDPFVALMDKISFLEKQKKITQEQVFDIVRAQGMPNLIALNSRPDLISGVVLAIDAVIAA